VPIFASCPTERQKPASFEEEKKNRGPGTGTGGDAPATVVGFIIAASLFRLS
jgi:hypothetical protein